MSNTIIILQRVKCQDDKKKRVIKISEMLKKPLIKMTGDACIKSVFNSGNSYSSMFLQPIDQQYSQNPFEENTESQNLNTKFDILNYSTDSSEEYQKMTKECMSNNILAEDDMINIRLTSNIKNGHKSINQFMRHPINPNRVNNSYTKQTAVNCNLTTNKISTIYDKYKLTKLLITDWQHKICAEKNKCFQKIILHLHMRDNITDKRSKNKLDVINSQNNFFHQTKKNISFSINDNFYNSKNSHPSNLYINNDCSSNEYNINKTNIKRIKADKKQMTDKINFTCNKDINYFAVNKVCKYKENSNSGTDLIKKIKYRRPFSVD